jgi:hypothetical protein
MRTSGVFCSFGDNRSWTDLITNVVVLSEVQLDQDLEKLTGWGTSPRNLLPSFLHEATHHWCFLSPVGSVVAALQLRARRRAQTLLRTNPAGKRRIELQAGLLEDLIRAETVTAFLRPLAEGLSLYTEFDAMTNQKSSILSLPLEMASYFSGDLELSQTPLGLTPVLVSLLRSMRLDQRCIQRKVGVFGHPLAYTDGGYFLGYLTVRRLWIKAAGKDGRLLNETDLFLMYLRSFFFDDIGLVAKLLDPTTKELESASAISNYVNQRILTFIDDVQQSDIATYEHEVIEFGRSSDKGKIPKFLTSLRVESDLYDLGSQLSTRLVEQLGATSKGTVNDVFRLQEAEIFGRRDIMYLGSIPVEVVVHKDGKFQVFREGMQVTDGQAHKGVAAGNAEGSLDLFFSMLPRHRYRVVSITRGKDVVLKKFIGPKSMPKSAVKRFSDFEPSRSIAQSRSDEFSVALEQVLVGSWMEICLTHIRNQLGTLVESVYLPVATYGVSDAHYEKAYPLMQQNGLLSLLNWDRELIEGTALLGLCCNAISPHRGFVSAWFKKSDLDLDLTLAGINKCTKEYGIPEVYEAGGQLLATV